MAHDAPAHEPRGFEDHKATYEGFLAGSVALGLICGYILVALVAFRFMDSFNVLTGFGGLIIGILATLIGVRAGGKWALPGALLVIYGLFVAINV